MVFISEHMHCFHTATQSSSQHSDTLWEKADESRGTWIFPWLCPPFIWRFEGGGSVVRVMYTESGRHAEREKKKREGWSLHSSTGRRPRTFCPGLFVGEIENVSIPHEPDLPVCFPQFTVCCSVCCSVCLHVPAWLTAPLLHLLNHPSGLYENLGLTRCYCTIIKSGQTLFWGLGFARTTCVFTWHLLTQSVRTTTLFGCCLGLFSLGDT